MSETQTRALKRTALYDEHRASGGRIVPFAGFEMPVQYAGILKEHDAVRKRAGLFDLSHMAQFELHGAEVGAWADELTVNDVATMKIGQARYNIFTNERGGCMDDVLFYRLGELEWLLVVNAGNAEKMGAYLQERRAAGVRIANRHGDRALIAVQGPRALEVVAPLLEGDDERAALRSMKYYSCAPRIVAGTRALIARTGYTGEDGFELFVDGADARALWGRLSEIGAEHGVQPAGLGARDVLRLEAGMPLYGFELTEELSPIAGGQQWAVKLRKPQFPGRSVLTQQLESDAYDRIAGIVVPGRVPARTGYAVFRGAERVGEIRSASPSPSLQTNIATALLRKDACEPGTELSVDIRGSRHDARVVALPFYKRS
jgi:aminomethyltransferase